MMKENLNEEKMQSIEKFLASEDYPAANNRQETLQQIQETYGIDFNDKETLEIYKMLTESFVQAFL